MSSQVREPVSRFEVRRLPSPSKPFGLSAGEIAVSLLVLAFLILVAVYYFVSLRPEQDRLQKLEAELAAQQRVLMETVNRPGEGGTDNVDTSRQALDSLEAFKSDHLLSIYKGRILLIDDINAIARKNNVALATGLDMKLDRPVEGKEEEASKRKKEEQRTDIFPRLNVRFSVIGQYPNLRAFINDLDHNEHFIAIHSITLSSVEQTTDGGGRGRRSSSGGVSLSIELSAYFQTE
ncbi:MAG: hypothetical protein L0229_29555 [Blastocatellia bacterium]|nr:hypothetical protein [Blastocatellia bacterium]